MLFRTALSHNSPSQRTAPHRKWRKTDLPMDIDRILLAKSFTLAARELGNYLLSKNFHGIRTDRAVPPAGLMPKGLLAQSIKENSERTQVQSSDGDEGIMGALLGVGATFAVGLGVVLLASALGGSNKK